MSKTLEQFTRGASEPRAWMQAGNDLLKAAWLIWDSKFAEAFGTLPKGYRGIPSELFDPFFLLAGFGLENLLKGLRVHQLLRGKQTIVLLGQGKLTTDLVTHDLTKLAKDTDIHPLLSHGERGILRRLTLMTKWAGRYPVERTFTGELNPRLLVSTDRRDIESIVNYIRAAEKEFWIVHRSTPIH